MAARSTPRPLARPPAGDLVLLTVAVVAVSCAAPLIRAAAAPAFAVALWRNLLATAAVAPVAFARRRGELAALRPRERRMAGGAGLLLAAHFAAWIPSLSYTSIASSVALVATQPVWAALLARFRGERVPGRAWVGILAAFAGTVLLTGIDVSISGRALFGDALAIVGGFLAAAYVTVGAEVRRTVSTTVYTTVCYATAAVVLAAVCVSARQPLSGYPARTWLCLAGLAAGPQLLGHSVVNRVLRTTSPTVVSVAILFEVAGATILARLFFGETPPAGTIPAAALIVAGVAAVVLAGEPAGMTGVPALE